MVLEAAGQIEDERKIYFPTHHHMKNPGNRFGWLMRVEEVVVGLQIQVSQEEVEALVLPGAYQILLWKEAVEWLAVPLKCCHFYLLEEEEVGEALIC